MSGKKRKYNAETYPEFNSNYGYVSANRSFVPSMTMNRYQIIDSMPFQNSIVYPYTIATATEPCEITNLIFDIDVSYDANQYYLGGMFENLPTPRISWALVTISGNSTGILSPPSISGNFYIPEQRLWRGGILHLSPVFRERRTTRDITHNIVSNPSTMIENYNAEGEIAALPAAMLGSIQFATYTSVVPTRDYSQENDDGTIMIKKEKIKGYSTEVKKLQVGDRLMLLINSNFTNIHSQVMFCGTLFFNQYV